MSIKEHVLIYDLALYAMLLAHRGEVRACPPQIGLLKMNKGSVEPAAECGEGTVWAIAVTHFVHFSPPPFPQGSLSPSAKWILRHARSYTHHTIQTDFHAHPTGPTDHTHTPHTHTPYMPTSTRHTITIHSTHLPTKPHTPQPSPFPRRVGPVLFIF